MAEDQDITFNADEDLDDSVVAEEHMGDAVKKLKEKLRAAEEKAKEYLDSWQRAQADFVNLRKRDEEAKSEFLKFANAQFIEDLLPVLDALESAVSHPDSKAELATGQAAILKLFQKVLRQHGLEESNPLGEMFDPRYHEAIGMAKTENKDEDHKILEVMQKGYIMNGKIIRPAKVKVGEFNS